MPRTENEALSDFLTMIENKWRDMKGIPQHVKVTVTDKEPQEMEPGCQL